MSIRYVSSKIPYTYGWPGPKMAGNYVETTIVHPSTGNRFGVVVIEDTEALGVVVYAPPFAFGAIKECIGRIPMSLDGYLLLQDKLNSKWD